MSDRTPIEWTDATWNPIQGCTRVSPGCVNCYAEIMAARFSDPGQWGHGLATRVALPGGGIDHRWTGTLRPAPEATLLAPLRWKRARRIFVNSTSDLFHEKVPFGWIMRVLNVIAQAARHIYQILTKRAERMREFFAMWHDLSGEDHGAFKNARGPDAVRKAHPSGRGQLFAAMLDAMGDPPPGAAWPTFDWQGGMMRWGNDPFPNVWLGTSVEDQATADTRIPHLLATPAAVRFISAEPLLAGLEITPYLHPSRWGASGPSLRIDREVPRLDWVICGGESGPGARPMHPDWPRSLRDQCVAADVPFFFKQWGEWRGVEIGVAESWPEAIRHEWPDGRISLRKGKKAAGRLLYGRTWDQFPGDAP